MEGMGTPGEAPGGGRQGHNEQAKCYRTWQGWRRNRQLTRQWGQFIKGWDGLVPDKLTLCYQTSANFSCEPAITGIGD